MTCLSFAPDNPVSSPLPLCDALNKVIAAEPSEFAALKGELSTENADGSKNYSLKITFDGWASNEYVKSTESASVDIQSENSTKEKAIALFTQTAKQIATCTGAKGEKIQADGIEELQVFTKGKVEIGLMRMKNEDKNFVVISISRAS